MITTKEYDVVVCGGGASGVCAAIAAAREGAKTLLIERVGTLGGQISFSGPPGFAFAHLFNPLGEQDAAGLIEEMHSRLLKEGHALPHIKPEERLAAGYTFSYIDPEWFNFLLFEMIEESGAELLLHSLVVDVAKEGDVVKGVIVENTNGRMLIPAKIVIECTGEGDIATRAGAPFEMVDRDTIQPHTVSFTVDGVDWKKLLKYVNENPDQFSYFEYTLPHWSEEKVQETKEKVQDFLRNATDITQIGELMGFYKFRDEALKNGEWHDYSGVGFFLTPKEGGVVQAHFQHSSQWPNALPTDAWDLTRTEIECRRQNKMAFKFVKKYLPGFENSYITKMCPEVRIREGRRIMGDYKLTREDVKAGRKFDDVIGKSHFKAGAHHVCNTTTLETVAKVCPENGGSYDIPYRCLVPQNVENMLVAGKMVSTDRDSYLRYVQQNMVTGQAAGIAAYLCVRDNITPRELEKNVKELQERLEKQGAILYGTH